MKVGYVAAFSMLAGMIIGSLTPSLYAQTKPRIYLFAQNEVTDPEAYLREFSVPTRASVEAAGGRYLVIGGNITPLDGTPPKSRIVIQAWESMEKLKAWYYSPQFEAIKQTGMKHAVFHTCAVEGISE